MLVRQNPFFGTVHSFHYYAPVTAFFLHRQRGRHQGPTCDFLTAQDSPTVQSPLQRFWKEKEGERPDPWKDRKIISLEKRIHHCYYWGLYSNDKMVLSGKWIPTCETLSFPSLWWWWQCSLGERVAVCWGRTLSPATNESKVGKTERLEHQCSKLNCKARFTRVKH